MTNTIFMAFTDNHTWNDLSQSSANLHCKIKTILSRDFGWNVAGIEGKKGTLFSINS